MDALRDFHWKEVEDSLLYRFVFLVKVKRIPERRR
jgi:hypothetical protein